MLQPMLTHKLGRLVQRALREVSYEFIPTARKEVLESQAAIGSKSALLGMLDQSELRRALDLLGRSCSQINQDFFVLHELDWARGGYFVEFGATDGRTNSNTYLLEREFDWTGILAEPARTWHKSLSISGRRAHLDFDCVWSSTGEHLAFEEASWAELSTLGGFTRSDAHRRHPTASYTVATVSLNDLLERHGAPSVIDYLSIDTEGSELEILQAVDFDRYKFRCITCEHNFTPARESIHALLTANGYIRKFATISQFDDWFVFAGQNYR